MRMDWGGVLTTRWWSIAGLAAVVLVLAAGCSSDSADPGPGLPSSPFSALSVPSSAQVASSDPSVSSSSVSRPTPSVADPPTPTTADPWPADLTPEQVADAKAAINAYRGFWRMVDIAVSNPGLDWSQQAAQYSTGAAKSDLIESLIELAPLREKVIGTTSVSPIVTNVDPGAVSISDCVDKTSTDILDSSGASIKAPDVVGSFFRHASTTQMAQLEDGRWVVVVQTDDWSQTC
jgi:hypothetical protein